MDRSLASRDAPARDVPGIVRESGWKGRADPGVFGAPLFASVPKPALLSSGWRALSLFSGCGGLDLGFASEGIGSELAIDSEPTCREAWQRNNEGEAVLRDLSAGLVGLPRPDVLIAGAPCQGFSTSGKRNLADSRNELLARVVDVSEVTVPRVIVVENVPAALSGRQRRHWEELEGRLKWLGYELRRVMLNAGEHGVAQHRTRLFLVAWRGSPHREFHLRGSNALTVRASFAGLDEAEESGEIVQLRDRIIARAIGPGQKLSNVRFGPRNVHTWDIPAVFGRTDSADRVILTAVARLRRRARVRSEGDGDPVTLARLDADIGFSCEKLAKNLVERGYLKWKSGGLELFHTYNGKFRRLEADGHSPTVDTHFGSMTNFLHPEIDRAMTLRETMRLLERNWAARRTR